MNIKNKILSNLSYAFCGVLGLLHFIFLAIPYVSFWGYTANGYKCMDCWESGFGGVMTSLFQILILILGISMLALSVFAFLKVFDVLTILPDEIGGIQMKKIAEFSVIGYAGANILLLIFLIIFCAGDMAGYVDLSAGVFITLIFGIGSVVALYLLPKYIDVNADGPTVVSVCSQCNQKVKSGVKFCPACGGAVTEQVYYPTIYACSKCNKKVKKGIAFCPDCGGAITEQLEMPKVYACSQCGQEAKKGTAFCSACGGAVVEKVVEQCFYVCSQCNTQVPKGTAFCTKCGGEIVEKK